MSTATYFELGTLTAETLASGRGDLLFGPAGAKVEGGRTVQLLPSSRDLTRLGELMRWIDSFIGASPERELLEIGRFELLFGLVQANHALATLRSLNALGVSKLEWQTAASVWTEPWRLQLPSAARELGIELHVRTVAGTPALMQVASLLKEETYLWGSLAFRAVQRSTPPMSAKVLFVEYFRNNVHVVVPVIRALQDRGVESAVLATRRELAEALPNGTPCIELEKLLGSTALLSIVPPVARQFRAASRLAFGGASLWSTAGSSLLRAAVGPLLLRTLWIASNWLARLGAAFDRIRPALIASTSYSGAMGRAAALAARRRGLPTVWVQHGMFPDHPVWSQFLNDHLVVFGESTRDSITRQGFDGSRVHPLGACPYDGFIAEVRSRAAARRHEHVVFFASRSGGMVVSREAARTAIELAVDVTRMLDLRLTVKPHPTDSTSIPEDVCRGHSHATVVRDRSSQALMLEADIVLVTSSTVGFEACIARKPMVEFNPSGVDDSVAYTTEGAAIKATNRSELLDALHALVSERGLRERMSQAQGNLLDRYLAGARGDACRRTAELLQRLAMPS